MLALLFLGSAIVAGIAVSRRLWAGAPSDADTPGSVGPWERSASAALLAFAIAVAASWSLSFVHALTRPALTAVALVLLSVSAWDLRSLARVPRGLRVSRVAIAATFALTPLLVWLAYVVWRDTLVFVHSNDALSYHLPKALYIARNRGYLLVDAPDARLATNPANYEMLLADILVLTGADNLVCLISPLSYLFFGLAAAAMAERWWGRGVLHALVAILFALGTPSVLLQSGTPKNDLLACAAMMAAVHWGARWAVRADRISWLLAIVATMLAVGTKTYSGGLLLALAPCVVWRARNVPAGERALGSFATLGAVFAVSVVAFFLLGGEAYALNVMTTGRPFRQSEGVGYGTWHHLFAYPVLAFLRGLTWSDGVWVPWRHQFWAVPQYDVFFSSYGPAASLALIALPFAVVRFRALGRRHERALASAGLALLFFVTLPVRLPIPPYGLFMGLSRYTPYAPVAVVLWTAVPFVRTRAVSRRGRATTWSVVFAASALLAWFAFGCATKEDYVPFDFVREVSAGVHPRRMTHSWMTRAASWIDAAAGPDDVVAFDGGFDGWIYPLFGKELRRQVVLLRPDRGPVVIPPNAKWVAVDRTWNCVFSAMPDMGVWYEQFDKGAPTAEDLVVYDQLKADPRFRLVYEMKEADQAVFERIE